MGLEVERAGGSLPRGVAQPHEVTHRAWLAPGATLTAHQFPYSALSIGEARLAGPQSKPAPARGPWEAGPGARRAPRGSLGPLPNLSCSREPSSPTPAREPSPGTAPPGGPPQEAHSLPAATVPSLPGVWPVRDGAQGLTSLGAPQIL